MSRVREIIFVQPKDLRPNSYNPNKESAEKFNLLVESIDDIGFSENIQVHPVGEGEVRVDDGQKRWYGKSPPSLEIIGGEHRWHACMVAGMENEWIPAVFFDDLEEEKLKAVTVRMNILKGEMDPQKFTALWDELSQSGHFSDQALRDMMGIASRGEFEKFYKEVKKSLPPDMQKELDKMKGEIRSIEDLSVILNRLFAKGGSDLEHSFMVFDFGNKQHVWIRMNRATRKLLPSVMEKCRAEKIDVNDLICAGFEHVLGRKDWNEAEDADLGIAWED